MADLGQEFWNFALEPPKTLYLHYHNVYGHQMWQGVDLPLGAPTHKVTCPLDRVALRDHVTNLKHISTTRVPMATRLAGWTVTLKGSCS